MIVTHCQAWLGSHPTFSSLQQSVAGLDLDSCVVPGLYREKTWPKGPIWEHGFILLFPECPLKAGAMVGPGRCPHWLLAEGKVVADGSISLLGLCVGRQERREERNWQIYSWIKASQRSFLPSPEHNWMELTRLWRGFPPSCQSDVSLTKLSGVWNMTD